MLDVPDAAATAIDVVVLNANTSDDITAMLNTRATGVARAGTRITTTRPDWGPLAVEGWSAAHASAAAMVAHMTDFDGAMDALIMAGFGDVGHEALTECVECPVIDITEAGVMAAQLVAERYAVITPTAGMTPLIQRSLVASGHWGRCVGIVPMETTIADLRLGPEHAEGAFMRAASQAVSIGAQALCIGTSVLSDRATRLGSLVDVPVIDPVEAAVRFAEVVVDMAATPAPRPPTADLPRR